jgi:hypothetical protein
MKFGHGVSHIRLLTHEVTPFSRGVIFENFPKGHLLEITWPSGTLAGREN